MKEALACESRSFFCARSGRTAYGIVTQQVREYLMELINILYEKEYFGFEENAQKYVEELFF